MTENEVWHTLFFQDVNMGIQKYFTHIFDSLFITYLNLEAFKIWSIFTIYLLRLYLRILTFLLFQCWTTTVLGEKTHFLSTFLYQDDYKLSHIYFFLMLLKASPKCIWHVHHGRKYCAVSNRLAVYSATSHILN